jgi:uncharacterized phiE125 gp8 family phage protein
MTMQIITQPTIEPVQPDDAKAAARIDGNAHDMLLPGYITAAREQAEQIAGRALVAQTRRHELRDWPADGEVLPEHGATAVAVTYWDGSAWASVSGVQFGAAVGGTLVAPTSGDWPTLPNVPARARVRIDITAGASYDAVPQCVRTYIMASVAHWVDNPGATSAAKLEPNPLFERLLDAVRVY